MFVLLCWLALVDAQLTTFISGYDQNVTSWQFSESTGLLTYLASSNGYENPSWMTWTRNFQYMYAVNEITPGGKVVAFRIDRNTLRLVNIQPSGGGSPCFISIHKSQRWAFVANYDDGYISVLPIDSTTGAVGPAVVNEKHGELAHTMLNDESGKFVFAVFKGSDYIAQFIFDEVSGKLTPNSVPYARTAPGSGPRHFVFHPTEKWVFIVTELSSTVVTCTYDSNAGQITPVHVISTLPADFHGSNTGAEILISPDGKYVYASNRGHNSIAIFSFSESTATLTSVGWEQGNGSIVTPRGVALDPSGTHLLVASQGANSISSFSVNSDGTLKKVEDITGLPTQPSFIGFIPRN